MTPSPHEIEIKLWALQDVQKLNDCLVASIDRLRQRALIYITLALVIAQYLCDKCQIFNLKDHHATVYWCVLAPLAHFMVIAFASSLILTFKRYYESGNTPDSHIKYLYEDQQDVSTFLREETFAYGRRIEHNKKLYKNLAKIIYMVHWNSIIYIFLFILLWIYLRFCPSDNVTLFTVYISLTIIINTKLWFLRPNELLE